MGVHFNHRHGESHYRDRRPTPEYTARAQMLARCLNPKNPRFSDYGGRGIAVCDRWVRGEGGKCGFECFLADMGRKPSAKHSLDRRDNTLGYCKANCRWATPTEQNRNRRGLHIVDWRGRKMPLSEACQITGIDYHVAKSRINRSGWSVEKALTAPNANVRLVPLAGRLVSINEASRLTKAGI